MVDHNAITKKLEKLKNDNKVIKEKVARLQRENKHLHKALNNNNFFIDSAPANTFLFQDNKVLQLNRSLIDKIGFEEDEISEPDFLESVSSQLDNITKDFPAKHFNKNRATANYETKLITRKGQKIACEINVNKIKIGGKKAYIASLFDIEGNKKKEAEIILSEKFSIFKTFIFGLNKKYKKNLDTINSETDWLLTNQQDKHSPVLKKLEKIKNSLNQIKGLSIQMEQLYHLKTDPKKMETFNLKDTVEIAIDKIRSGFKQISKEYDSKINLKAYLRSNPIIKGYPHEIRDILIGILNNSIDAMPKGGDIYLTIEKNAENAFIYIQDCGTGIPNRIKGKIFDPFFSTKGDDSSGLGLCFAQSVIRRHKGELEVEDNDGTGTLVTIMLPLSPGKPKLKNNIIRHKVKSSPILVIENNGLVGGLLSQYLKSKGFNVTIAYNGIDGIKRLKKQKFDMIILDSENLELELNKFLLKLRHLDRNAPLAVITKKQTNNDWKAKVNVDLIITKPVNMDRFLDRITEKLVAHHEKSRNTFS